MVLLVQKNPQKINSLLAVGFLVMGKLNILHKGTFSNSFLRFMYGACGYGYPCWRTYHTKHKNC